MFNWFATAEAERFGAELARYLLRELEGARHKPGAKFAAKAEDALRAAEARVTAFKTRERMNFLKKAKLANAFLWALRDAGCSKEYSDQLTEWLSFRL